jgi:uncharacterized damage-inducible protein DinB
MKTRLFVFVLVLLFASPSLFIAKPSGDGPVFVQEFNGQMDFVKGRLLQLAEAMPDAKYSWAPAEGVRTVGEVYTHAAEANYYLIAMMNGVKPDMDQEKSPTDKKTALSILEKSFDAVKVDLNKEVEAFGIKFSLRNFMITILNHNHEHLGQSIAYARMNGVTPPWSKKGE